METNNDVAYVTRERKSVPILGIDRSTPDDLVEDGKCAELNNLRYKDGAWRTVKGFSPKQLFVLDPDYEIAYHHPATGEHSYIVRDKKSQSLYYLADFTKVSSSPTLQFIAGVASDVTLSHFGNILIFNDKNNGQQYYLYKDGEYVALDVFNIYPLTRLYSQNFEDVTPDEIRLYGVYDDKQYWRWEDIPDALMNNIKNKSMKVRSSTFNFFNLSNGTAVATRKDGKWRGEIMLFATFILQDGSVTSPSPLHLLHSHYSYTPIENVNRFIYRGYGLQAHNAENAGQAYDTSSLTKYISVDYESVVKDGIAQGNVPLTDPQLSYWLPNIQIRIPTDIMPIVDSVALWVTRINPIFTSADTSKSSILENYANNDLPNQPFYLYKEFKTSEFSEDGYASTDITYDELENAIHRRVYVPNNNVHSFAPDTSLDYNMRQHIGGYKLLLANGYSIADGYTEGTALTINQSVTLRIDDNTYNVEYTDFIEKTNPLTPYSYPMGGVISYPDYRAEEYQAGNFGNFALQKAVGNNFAYFIPASTEYEKFPCIFADASYAYKDVYVKDVVAQHNKIIVSDAANPLSFQFANTYSFGSASNKILAMQSAAIQIADEKTGDLPLLVFTEEGIFALRAGTETLYARTDVINYDKIINPNTLAVNGGVIYITQKGVHLLVGRESNIISTPIHDINGEPPTAFLKECKLILSKQYNEVIFFNEAAEDGRAYVYNVGNGYWSTRDMSGTKLNTDELVVGNTILDASEEVETESANTIASIVTRPVKLGDVEFKRLETIIPRMSADNCSWNIDIDASRIYPTQWETLRNANHTSCPYLPAIIRRTPYSAKYFRFALTKGEGTGFAITHFDVEWYKKLRRRMR